ncbi:MAG TPA: DUF1707 and FHA domain-containing protein [Streptosporangiaceae bacterium]|jgi:hypothetical protein
MAASSADAPTNPDAALRASDSERERAVSELGDRFAEGRLSQETYLRRMDEAFGARDRHQLDGLFTDLPRRSAAPRGRAVLGTLRDALREAVFGPQRGRWPEPLERPDQRRPPARPPARPADAAPVSESARALYFPPTGPGQTTSFTIGRDASCDLLIEHTSVSRWHARLDRTADGWVLTDAGSTNGTRVNGWRVRQPVPVRPGDYVMFGSAVFVVCAGGRGRGAAGSG